MASIITPYTKGAGYKLNNQNFAVGQGREEADIRLCTHCETVIELQGAWKDDGGFCGKCMAPICGPCADLMLTHGCTPFLKSIEQAVENSINVAQHRKVAGLDAKPEGWTPSIMVVKR